MQSLVIIPTYNEKDNIENIIRACFEAVTSDISILVVDDSSPDGTSSIVENLQNEFSNLFLIKRNGERGLASAYIDGFKWGLANRYDVFVEMDADFSHNPKYLNEMLEKIKVYDVVIGSRNIKGGKVKGWSFLRDSVSKWGSLYARMVLGCGIKDLTGGFNAWQRCVLEKMDFETIISKGYMIQIELKYRAFKNKFSIIELPIGFVDRKQGVSKMNKKIFFEALFNIWKI